MTTAFDSLPIVDLSILSSTSQRPPSSSQLASLSQQLYDVFATTGFAYLVNSPLSFDHDEVFDLAAKFFSLPEHEKWDLAKKTFREEHANTYRGYFPAQPGTAPDNLKEGFEIGPSSSPSFLPQSAHNASTPFIKSDKLKNSEKFNFSEPNVWPTPSQTFPIACRERLEMLYSELQSLSSTLLSLLAVSLGKEADFFAPYLLNSISTLRLLHYPRSSQAPTPPQGEIQDIKGSAAPTITSTSTEQTEEENIRLCCTPHTDSGILTLLHQDSTGGLEVLNSAGKWIAAPYVPGSIVVNIGDLMARVSGGRFVATMHRVRAPPPPQSSTVDHHVNCNGRTGGNEKGATVPKSTTMGRFSVPFFFEPGEKCLVQSVDCRDDGDTQDRGVVYGDHLRRKMSTWVEFQDPVKGKGKEKEKERAEQAVVNAPTNTPVIGAGQVHVEAY